MRVQYIDHSGFYAETAEHAFLFDYFRGSLPDIPEGKHLVVCVSHGHPDHYTPEIFPRYAARPRTDFVAAEGVKLPRTEASVSVLAPHGSACLAGAEISTLRSTDEGVAFFIRADGKTILHMGDLNWWDWGAEDTPEEAEQMKRDFCGEVNRLRGETIDVAFVPLDPRLGENFWRGADYLLRTADVRTLIPMHTWGEYTMAARLREKVGGSRCRILDLTGPGQIFELEENA